MEERVTEKLDIAVIGAGPAGMTAGLYGARARARTVVFDRGMPGGQIVNTERVENYPAFPDGISGPELGELMHKQAARFGTEFRTLSPVEKLRTQGGDFVLTVDGEEVWAHSVIVATGAIPKKLGVPGEAEFTGRGVSWCATCDGALFRDKEVCVVGGGDAALQEALFLSKFATRVHVIHRRDQLRATECIQEYCFLDTKIHFVYSRVVSEIVGEGGRLKGVQLQSTKGEPDLFLPLDGVFIFVGVDPVNELLVDVIELDAQGYALIDHDGLTGVPGLYAAGDITNGTLKQVVTAAGGGASAAFEALRYVEAKTCNM
jgi:thioredoxin reductase (NADPH)